MLGWDRARISVATSMLLVAFTSTGIAEDREKIEWQRSLTEAKRVAQESGKPMLIFVTSAGCRYCTQMKQTTLVDPVLVEEVNETFVPAYLDAGQNADVVRSLGIQAFPTTLLATPDGKVREMVRGYVGVDALRKRMRDLRGN